MVSYDFLLHNKGRNVVV